MPGMRNALPSCVMQHGFVELPALLSEDLCTALMAANMASDTSYEISNARELDCPPEHWAAVKRAVESSSVVREAMQRVYGTGAYCMDVAKLLEAHGQAPPQIPHADAVHNAGGMFGVVQLRGGQAPTIAAPYADTMDATKLFAEQRQKCAKCDHPLGWLTDEQARHRQHLPGSNWTCEKAGHGACAEIRPGKRRRVSSRQEAQRTNDFFSVRVCDAFRPLLQSPERLIESMVPCGDPEPGVGDGLLALPTLIHRGPGGGGRDVARRVLFFFVRPAAESYEFQYDSSAQVHAAFLLTLAEKRERPDWLPHCEAQRVRQVYKELSYDLLAFEPTAGLRGIDE